MWNDALQIILDLEQEEGYCCGIFNHHSSTTLSPPRPANTLLLWLMVWLYHLFLTMGSEEPLTVLGNLWVCFCAEKIFVINTKHHCGISTAWVLVASHVLTVQFDVRSPFRSRLSLYLAVNCILFFFHLFKFQLGSVGFSVWARWCSTPGGGGEDMGIKAALIFSRRVSTIWFSFAQLCWSIICVKYIRYIPRLRK